MSFLQTIEHEYINAINTFSNINEHIDELYSLAMDCESVSELVRRPTPSTIAFLKSNAKFNSYNPIIHDFNWEHNIILRYRELFGMAQKTGKDVTLHEVNPNNQQAIDMEPADLMFFAPWCSNQVLSQVLNRNGMNAKKFLVFHNTHVYGVIDEKIDWQSFANTKHLPNEGIIQPIVHFVMNNPCWKFKTFKSNNNGLIVLERTP